jgi:hypothetical protein
LVSAGAIVARHYILDFQGARLTFARVTSPFRDEVETLRRENEHLRAQLAGVRSGRPAFGFSLLLAAIGAALLMRPWLNGGDDWHFWGALSLLGLIIAAASWVAVGHKPRTR